MAAGDVEPNLYMVVFGSQTIRRIWVEDRWYFSIVDVVGLLAQTGNPRKYWYDMKRRIETEEFRQLSASCRQLKMKASDGKFYVTDAADTQTLLRLTQSIPSPNAEPVKQWLAQVGAERLAELEDPALAVDRARAIYQAQGYPEEWIEKRLHGIVIRQELTDEWRERGAEEGREFAILTDGLHQGTFDLKIAEHRVVKALKKRDNLRDSMTPLELALTSLAEATATEFHESRDSQGFSELSLDVHDAGGVAGTARRSIEAQSGRPVVSNENYKTLTNKVLRRPQQQPLIKDGEQGSQDVGG